MKNLKIAKNQFKVIIERDEDGYFVAEVPALPGCHTQAKTFQALMKNVKEVIQLCLEEAEHDPAYRKRIADFGYEPTMVGVELVTI